GFGLFISRTPSKLRLGSSEDWSGDCAKRAIPEGEASTNEPPASRVWLVHFTNTLQAALGEFGGLVGGLREARYPGGGGFNERATRFAGLACSFHEHPPSCAWGVRRIGRGIARSALSRRGRLQRTSHPLRGFGLFISRTPFKLRLGRSEDWSGDCAGRAIPEGEASTNEPPASRVWLVHFTDALQAALGAF